MDKTQKTDEDQLIRFGVAVPESLLKLFDKRFHKQGVPTRSQALRQLIRDFVTADTWQSGQGEVYGSITITYNHDTREAGTKMTEIQHHYKDVILCTTHIHANERGCLEVIMLRGPVPRVKKLIEEMRSLKAILSLTPVVRALV